MKALYTREQLIRDRFVCECVCGAKTGAPGAIPTRDLPLRRRTLYAAELRAQ